MPDQAATSPSRSPRWPPSQIVTHRPGTPPAGGYGELTGEVDALVVYPRGHGRRKVLLGSIHRFWPANDCLADLDTRR